MTNRPTTWQVYSLAPVQVCTMAYYSFRKYF